MKYIPIWIEINLGDEVITSGMDNIFFKGLKVGKVVSINKMADQQEAFIKKVRAEIERKDSSLIGSKSQWINGFPGSGKSVILMKTF